MSILPLKLVRVVALALSLAVLTGCTEGEKPNPLKRVGQAPPVSKDQKPAGVK